ncbi:MAG: T9SS type A sorting domain-containing protein [Ignavibacteria bacterium]|nr:T9SS type A sorting domain-containing protein [Ignavibacteria bacterium]
MKKLFLQLVVIALILNSSFLINNSVSQWVQVGNEMGNNRYINSLTSNSSYIFASTDDSGVYRSTNNGTNWIHTSLNNKATSSLIVSENNIFAGTGSTGSYVVYFSTDNGNTWNQTNLNKGVACFAILGSSIFAGTEYDGVYISTINGTSWTQTALNNRSIYSLLAIGNSLFAGTDIGVYLSNNNGTNWTQTTLNNVPVLSLSTIGNNIFAGTYYSNNGFYLSTNSGVNWTAVPTFQTILSFEVSGTNLFAGNFSAGVYLSTDNGSSWLNKNQGFPSSITINKLLIANNYIFAASQGKSVWRRFYTDIIGIKNIGTEIPAKYSLSQNYPNPFNPVTNLEFGISKLGFVTLKIYDLLGKEVATLVNEKLNPGTYRVEFDAGTLTSGVYFYRLTSGDFTDTKRMLLIK